MPSLPLISAREQTAAKICDMSVQEFRAHVEAKRLPGPNEFGRWHVATLDSIMKGEKIDDLDEVFG